MTKAIISHLKYENFLCQTLNFTGLYYPNFITSQLIMSDMDSDYIECNDYNAIVTTLLTDSSGDRDVAAQIINERLDLKPVIIYQTKKRLSTISHLNTRLFKMMTEIPWMYHSNEYYVEQSLNLLFPITLEDIDTKKTLH